MKLKAIELYCQNKNINRSVLLVNSAMSVVNANRVLCEYQGCRRSSIGKYNLTVYDLNEGEKKFELNLCEFHFNEAKKSGVVTPIS